MYGLYFLRSLHDEAMQMKLMNTIRREMPLCACTRDAVIKTVVRPPIIQEEGKVD